MTQDNPEFAHSVEKLGTCNYDLDDLDVRWLGLAKSNAKKGEFCYIYDFNAAEQPNVDC